MGESQRSKAGAWVPPEACPDSVLPVTQGNKLPSIEPAGVRTLNYLQQKALSHSGGFLTMSLTVKFKQVNLTIHFNYWSRMFGAANNRMHDEQALTNKDTS